ncbi:hypothetical protein CVT25_004231 [Psilocybe cyanescens]|uniref:Uncharacterized protein n=1 Tax=Psilocybe cyanescens TaxID=93625 RepID=A0A409X312_PSICY|nr:hypothetical protein CVT25_004231 [Psilocybe cyanescens]
MKQDVHKYHYNDGDPLPCSAVVEEYEVVIALFLLRSRFLAAAAVSLVVPPKLVLNTSMLWMYMKASECVDRSAPSS